jgi:hypothetical protein
MTRLVFIFSFFSSWVTGFTQENYNFKKADKILSEEFFKGSFWTMPTDENDACYFQSKSEAKKTATIRTIPVARLKEDSSVISFESDYSIYLGFLFKKNSFLCPLFINAYHNIQGNLKPYMTIGWNPSPDFIKHYIDNASHWFYSPSITDFVFVKNSNYYVWDDEGALLKDYTEHLITSIKGNERKIGYQFTGIDTLGVERITKYHISKEQSDFKTLMIFRSDKDTVQIGPVLETTSNSLDGMNRVIVKTGGDSYVISIHPKREWIDIETNNHRQIASLIYSPGTTTPYNQLRFYKFNRISKRLVELDVKIDLRKGIEFIPVKNKETLVVAKHLKEKNDDYLIIRERVQDAVNPKMLRLTAIVIFWADIVAESVRE